MNGASDGLLTPEEALREWKDTMNREVRTAPVPYLDEHVWMAAYTGAINCAGVRCTEAEKVADEALVAFRKRFRRA